jgi:hypothetical protein
VGVPTSEALHDATEKALDIAAGMFVLLQPAGPSDMVLSRHGEPSRILPGGTDADLRPGERLVAVDLDGRVDPDSAALGRHAMDCLAAAFLHLGAPRLARGDADDLAMLVPEYVTLPRGVRDAPADGGVEVSGSRSR